MEHTVLIMPGHGGTDSGVVAADGTKEKDYVLEIGAYVVHQLESMGLPDLKVVLGRMGDTENPLAGRVRLSKTVSAQLVVELHVDSFVGEAKPRGMNAYYYQGNQFTRNLTSEFVRNAPESMWVRGRKGRCAKPSTFPNAVAVLESYPMDAIVVEMGYFSNPADVERLHDPLVKAQMVMGLVQSVFAWKEELNRITVCA